MSFWEIIAMVFEYEFFWGKKLGCSIKYLKFKTCMFSLFQTTIGKMLSLQVAPHLLWPCRAGLKNIWLCVSHQALVLSGGDHFVDKDNTSWVGNLTQQTLKLHIPQSATWTLLTIQSVSSSQRALRKASSTRWVLVHWRCTRKKRTLETRYALGDSVGRRECWPAYGSTGRVLWWCRTLWKHQWSNARAQPGWRKCQRDWGPRRGCE